MSTPAQLRIAARIHYALKNILGEGIDVAAMLNDPTEAREVLFVCQASGNAALQTLANLFTAESEAARLAHAASQARAKTRAQAARRDALWSRFAALPTGLSPTPRPTQPTQRTPWLKALSLRFMR